MILHLTMDDGTETSVSLAGPRTENLEQHEVAFLLAAEVKRIVRYVTAVDMISDPDDPLDPPGAPTRGGPS